MSEKPPPGHIDNPLEWPWTDAKVGDYARISTGKALIETVDSVGIMFVPEKSQRTWVNKRQTKGI